MNIKNIFWFCCIECLLWCVLSLAYFFISGFYPSWTGAVFAALFIPGNCFFFAIGLFVLLALSRLLGRCTAAWSAVLLGGFFNVALLLDIFIYTQYRFHISGAMLQLFFGPAGREIFILPMGTYLLFAVAVLLIFTGTWGLTRLARKIPWGAKAIAIVSTVFFLLFAGYNAMYAWGKFMAVPSILTQAPYLPWAQPLSANGTLRRMGFTPAPQPYETPRAGTLNYPMSPLACAPKQKPNILLIMIDCLRADSFTPQEMPNTYKAYTQSKNAFYFTNHLAGGNATQASVFSLFYSAPVTYWDTVTASRIRPVLMEELDKQGYQFGIYASANLTSPEFHQNIFSHIDNLRLKSNGNGSWDRDLDMQNDFLHFLDTRDKKKPFFGFLFYDSPHGMDTPPGYDMPFTPYAKQINYLLLTNNTDPTPYLNRLRNSVHYVDSLLGKVFQTLKTQGLDKNTIVILTGDHGQEANDTRNNFWGHNSNFSKWQTQVPLLVWWPGMQGEKREYRSSHYDIVPALLKHALGCTNPTTDYSSGYDLFDPIPRPWTLMLNYTNKAIREGNNISVLNNYGGISNYDENFVPTNKPVSAKALTEGLKEISHFYK